VTSLCSSPHSKTLRVHGLKPGPASTLSISGRFQRAMSPLEQQLDRAIGQCTSEAPAIATDQWRSSQPIHNRTEWSPFRQAASAGVLTGSRLPVVHHDVRFGARNGDQETAHNASKFALPSRARSQSVKTLRASCNLFVGLDSEPGMSRVL